MAPSASKQKRLEAKLAKASKNASKAGSLKSTPAASTAGDTPAISANGSFADLSDAQAQMRKLNVATNRSAVS
jgi:ATP-binding cassette subfamily F protein 2